MELDSRTLCITLMLFNLKLDIRLMLLKHNDKCLSYIKSNYVINNNSTAMEVID